MVDKFGYFLFDKNGKSYSVAANGSVVATTSPTPLEEKPIGWAEIELSFDTVDKYFSNIKALSVPLQYVYGGAKILRYLLYRGKGFEEELYCVILKLNPNNGIHELEYNARIDFTKAIDDPKIGVTVNAKEGGFQSDLDANEDVNYEFPLTSVNPDAVNVMFDGIDLYDAFSYQSYDLTVDVLASNYASTTLHGIREPYVIVPLVYLSNEGDNVGVASGGQTFEVFRETTFLDTSVNTPFETFAATKNVKIEGKFPFSIGNDYKFGNVTGLFKAYLYVKSETGLDEIEIASFAANYGGSYTVDINTTINVPQNSKLFLVFRFPTEVSYLTVPNTGRDTKYKVTFFESSKLKISFTSRNNNSQAYALPPLAIANAIVKKWNPKYSVQSQWLTVHNNIVATSGQALRNLPNPVLKYSFSDFWDDYNKEYCLCMNIIGNVMYIEKREVRFSSNTGNVIFNLGYLPNFTLSPIDKNIINTIKVGWPDQTYDERNGKYEFNSQVELNAPIKAKKAELNLIGKARGDAYGIEFIRGKLNNKDTTDNPGDNQVFMVNIVPGMDKTAEFGIDWTASNNTLKFYGQAALVGSFPVGAVFETVTAYSVGFNNYLFTVVSATVNGADLDVVVAEAYPATTAFFPGYIIFPCKLKRVQYNDITGVPVPIIDGVPRSDVAGAPFNVEEMRPYDRLAYWEPWLRSVLFQLPQDKITFQTALKNADLKTVLSGKTKSEKLSKQVSSLSDPFFLNYAGKFTIDVPFTFAKTMATMNSAALITGVVNGFPLSFLPIGKMSSKPATNEAQEWELVLSAKNDLATIEKLSDEEIFFINAGMNNTLTVSIVNPVHYVYYNKTLNARYKYKDLFDDWVHHRNSQFAAQPAYTQKWEFTDVIKQQFISVGLSQIDLYLYDCEANEVDIIQSYVVSDTAVISPNVLLQIDLDPATYPEGLYVYVLKAADEILLISEWQHFAAKQDGTYAHEYFHTYNKMNAYWTNYRPMLRVEAMWDVEKWDGSTTDYKDETRRRPLDFELESSRLIRYGDPYGIPEWMQMKLNAILRLNQNFIEGSNWYAASDAKWEIVQPNGYPLRFCSIELRRGNDMLGLSVSSTGGPTEPAIIWNVDAEAFGQAPGVIQIEVRPE